MGCALALLMTLCGVAKDRPVLRLAAVHAAAISWDGWTTRRFLDDRLGRFREVDPIFGPRPSAARYAATWSLEFAGAAWLAERMRRSDSRWTRRFWWAPQAAQSFVHFKAAAGNQAAWDRRR